jgi:DNA-binding LacI/PurR family transcriptional regulator
MTPSKGVPRRPTIYDVAAEAGVAPSTVSRAYARPGRVNSETAALIFAAAERVGYRVRPPEPRRPETDPATNAIGLVVADVTNPFYGDIIKGAYEAATEAGQQLILLHTNESPEVERQTIANELPRVDGLVIASSRMTDSALRMVAKQTSMVLLNRILPEASCVVTDNPRGMRRAAELLGGLGHRTVAYVAGPEASWSDGMRWRALLEASVELELNVRRIGPNEPTILAGFEASRRLVETDATAVLGYNDQLAIGVIRGLRKLGRAVPADYSVVGFDNIIFDELVEPQLTTVASPLYRMGFVAVRNCAAMIQGARHSGPPLVLPVRLVQRESTAQPRRKSTSPARGTTRVPGPTWSMGSKPSGSR